MNLYFATNNTSKFNEMKSLFEQNHIDKIDLKQVCVEFVEYTRGNIIENLDNKILTAFKLVKRPVFADYTQLKIKIDGNEAELDWGSMNNTIFKKLVGNDSYKSTATTHIVYCDGKQIYHFEGSISGNIKYDDTSMFMQYNWEGIFYPDGKSESLYEIKDKIKPRSSNFLTMREKAFSKFAEFISEKDSNYTDEYSNSNNYVNLKRLISENKVTLFVGSGISKNVGLPSWDQLIEILAKQLGYDPKVYKILGNNYKLAEYYEKNIPSGISKLRNTISREWYVKPEHFKNNKIYEDICKLNFSTIYTTNYDSCLENAFKFFGKEYNLVITASDLNKIDPNKTTIIKLHGDFSNDDSIVLTESSYYDRMNFDSALDIKLWSDTLEKRFLFIGYSLEDINMRYFFYRMNKLKKTNKLSENTNHFIFLHQNQPIDIDIFEKMNLVTIVEEGENSINKFLDNIVDSSKIFQKSLSNNDLTTLRLIQKADLHNHAPYGGSRENLNKYSDLFSIPNPVLPLNGIKGFEDWTNKYINKKDNNDVEKEKFLKRVQAAFEQASKDSIDPLILNFGYCAKKYFDNDYSKMTSNIEKLRKKYYNGNFIAEICFKRSMITDEINEELDMILKTNYFSSIDLIGDETEDVCKFKDAYEKAKKEGFILKAHIGETSGPIEIEKNIKTLNLDVINHGINIIKDENVMQLAYERNIVFNVCPSSNINLSYVTSYVEHPIRKMFNYNLNITINSDDLLVFDSDVSKEYLNLYKQGIFTANELNKIRLSSIQQLKKYKIINGEAIV